MRLIITVILCVFFAFKSSASHIVGGEMMYKYAGRSGNNYLYNITLYVYFDCKNAFEGVIEDDVAGITIHVFDNRNKNSASLSLSKENIKGFNPVTIADLNYNCIRNKPTECVIRYTYTTQLSLPDNAGRGYTVTFERCCRNRIIDNIMFPDATGATYWTEIKDVKMGNSSPFFKYLPPNFLCTNAPLNFDHSAIDDNGDSLVYELYQPFLGGDNGQQRPSGVKPDIFDLINAKPPTYPSNDDSRKVQWATIYNTSLQINGQPTLSVNTKTGKLTLTPDRTGNYVIGVKVLEYRKGVLIGETKRDYQFNISECVFDVVSAFLAPSLSCESDIVSFQNRSSGGTSYQWDFGDPSSSNNTSIQTNPSFRYSVPGTYTVQLVAKTNLCSDTFRYDIEVKERFKAQLPKDTLFCGPFTTTLISNPPNLSYVWNTGQTTRNLTVNRAGRYIVTATDFPCTSKDTIDIFNDLSKFNLGPDSVICRDSFVQFTYKGKEGYRSYLWNDNTTDASVFIPSLGSYSVKVVNQNGCLGEDTITFVLYPPPRTRLRDTFICEGTGTILDGENFHPQTQAETRYLWNRGDTTPQISVSQRGRYIVTAANKLCTIYDTADIDFYFIGLDLGPDTFYCGPISRTLDPKRNYKSYLWNGEITTKQLFVSTPGKYFINIETDEGCLASDTINIIQYPEIDGGLGSDTTICLSSKYPLVAADNMEEYLWNTGATTQKIIVTLQGTYTVTVRNKNGCIISDSIKITEDPNILPSDLFMPNAFTPNGDNINDVYPGNKYSDPGAEYQLRLYNRWGEQIFESNTPSVTWDGTIKGNLAPQDVYVFYTKYVGCDNIERWFRGTFHLIR